jgi:outer membrane lipase/esterase
MAATVLSSVMMTPPVQAQEFRQGVNAESLLDLDSIIGETPADRLGSLVGDIKTVCAGNLVGGGQVIPHGASDRLQLDCNSLVTAALLAPRDTSVVEAVEQIAAEEVASQGTLGVENNQLQARNVASRMIQVQTGAAAPRLTLADFGLASVAPKTFSVALGVAGTDEINTGFSRTSVFAIGSFYSGEQDPNRFEQSFDWDSYALTAGLDHRFTDTLFGGVSVGYTDTKGDFEANGGDVKSDNFTLSVFGGFHTDGGFYIDGLAGIGRTDYDTNRNVIYQIETGNVDLGNPDLGLGFDPVPGTPLLAADANVNQVARSSTDGDELSLSLGAGFDFQKGASTFTPRLRLDYLDISVDGFDETMCNRATKVCREEGNNSDGAGWAMAIGDQDIESLRASLGIAWKMALKRSWGVVLPYASVDYVHEFKDEARNVLFCFRDDVVCPGSAGVATSQDPFSILTASPDQDFFMLAGGFVSQFSGGKIAFVNLEHMVGNDDLKYTGITAGLRIEFN